MKNSIAGLAFSAALIAGAAEGATITYTTTSTGEDFEFSAFDANLGTLTDVVFEIEGTVNYLEADLVWSDVPEELNPTTTRATAFASLEVSLIGHTFIAEATDSTWCTYPHHWMDCYDLDAVADLSVSVSKPSLIPMVTAWSPWTLPVDVTFVGEGAVTVSITYTYDEKALTPDDNGSVDQIAPVPLPAAGGMLLAGLGGLSLLRRRRAA